MNINESNWMLYQARSWVDKLSAKLWPARPCFLFFLGSLLATQIAFAQIAKPLTVIVPFPAGGTIDVLMRLLGEKMSTDFPRGILVENKVGAGGNIGAEIVYRSEPDGRTLLASPPGPIVINHHLYKKLNYDSVLWQPISVLATAPNVLVVSPKVPAKNVTELVAYLKANPGKVTYASQGNGSTSHLTAKMFMQLTGTDMLHVPYNGSVPALFDLMAGNVDIFFDNLGAAAQFHESGKLRILAVADYQRSKILPQVPTFAEQKLPSMQAITFFTLVAPPGTSSAMVDSIYKSVSQALSDTQIQRKFLELGVQSKGLTPEQSSKFIRDESEKWQMVIKNANISLD